MGSESKSAAPTVKRVALGRLDDLKPGHGRVVEVDGRRLALFRVGDEVLCVDDRCPHAGGSLAKGSLQGCQVRCPRHGWRFDLRNGKCLSDPRFVVARIPVVIKDGDLFLELAHDE